MWKVKINNKDIMEKIDPPPPRIGPFQWLTSCGRDTRQYSPVVHCYITGVAVLSLSLKHYLWN